MGYSDPRNPTSDLLHGRLFKIQKRHSFKKKCSFHSVLSQHYLGASKQHFYDGEIWRSYLRTRLGTMLAQQAVLQQRLPRPGPAKVATLDCIHQALVMLAWFLTCLQVLLRVKSHARTELV